MPSLLSRLKSVDFYRKIPTDLTEATVAGASISLFAAVTIAFLLGMEFSSYMTVETKSEMVVDRSAHGELLRINFNISFPALSCEFLTLDVSDALGTKRMNLTRTVRKLPISESLERMGFYTADAPAHTGDGPKYDDEYAHGWWYQDVNISDPLHKTNWDETLKRYSIVLVNFYAPWCPWCQRLAPTWEAATEEVHNRYPEHDGRIRFAKVNCVEEVELCREHFITGFPSIRVFRHGSDEVTVFGHYEHEAYRGDRTKDALVEFAESLVPSAGQPHKFIPGVTRVAKSPGCNLSGFVLVKKVPGTMHFLAKSPGHSFDFTAMNMTHIVHHMYFGEKPSPRRRRVLEAMHPLGLTDDWADKMKGKDFVSANAHSTHEHYVQVVLTTVQPRSSKADRYNAYEYVVQSHTYTTDEIPEAKFTYDLSAIQIVIVEQSKAFYHFITSTCAVIGGVFTVAGIVDGLLHQSLKLAKKIELGKQT